MNGEWESQESVFLARLNNDDDGEEEDVEKKTCKFDLFFYTFQIYFLLHWLTRIVFIC